MTTATPSAQAMPAGTILQASDHLFYEVVRATAKTIWVRCNPGKNRKNA